MSEERRIIPIGKHSVFVVPPEMEHLFVNVPWWKRLRVRPFFRWYDLWIGLYIDWPGQEIYFCFLPMLGIKVSWSSHVHGS